ncbi:hypothetical protein Tco_1185243 [Tanacetum coccineum]
MKAVRSSSHVLIVPLLSSSNHVFASPVSDRGNNQADNFIFGISVFKHIVDFEEFMNVFMGIGIVIAKPGVGATTWSAAYMGSSSIGL